MAVQLEPDADPQLLRGRKYPDLYSNIHLHLYPHQDQYAYQYHYQHTDPFQHAH